MLVKCDFCGKDFNKRPAETKRTKHNFCTQSCSSRWRKKKRVRHVPEQGFKKGHIPWNKGTAARVNFRCAYCGREFSRLHAGKPYRYRNHFCSSKCYRLYMKAERHPMWKRVKVECSTCGKEFYATRWQYQRALLHYCSTECRKKISRVSHQVHHSALLEVTKQLEDDGFRCIPVHWLTPDAIALRDGKVLAVELYRRSPVTPSAKQQSLAKWREKYEKIGQFFDELLVFYNNNLEYRINSQEL